MKRSDFDPDPRVALKEMEAHLKAGFAHKRAIVDSELPMEAMFTALLKPDERHYDYTNQAWVVNGHYVSCGHPDIMSTGYPCDCYGRLHAGERAQTPVEKPKFEDLYPEPDVVLDE